jgi:hypothetical protein
MRNRLAIAALLGGLLISVPAPPVGAQQTQPVSASEIDIPLSDARNIGPNSVRFSAAQFTDRSPTIVLFGATTASWHKVRAAAQQAVFEGYPVRMIFIGPTDAPRALEVYARGHHVTNPIDPETISEAEITRVLRDVSREYYPR